MNDSIKYRWDLIIIMCAIYNCLAIPFKICFEPKVMFERGFEIGDTIIDFIFLFDIIITFRTVFIDDIGQEVSNPKLIAKNYITGQFWFDLMATIPMDLILEKVTGDNLKIY